MTYQKLADITEFLGRLQAEEFCQDFVAIERRHCERVVEAIEEIKKERKDKNDV